MDSQSDSDNRAATVDDLKWHLLQLDQTVKDAARQQSTNFRILHETLIDVIKSEYDVDVSPSTVVADISATALHPNGEISNVVSPAPELTGRELSSDPMASRLSESSVLPHAMDLSKRLSEQKPSHRRSTDSHRRGTDRDDVLLDVQDLDVQCLHFRAKMEHLKDELYFTNSSGFGCLRNRKSRDAAETTDRRTTGYRNSELKDSDGAIDLERPVKPCPGGCGFQVTWHRSHCCAICCNTPGKHGPRCQKKRINPDANINDDTGVPTASRDFCSVPRASTAARVLGMQRFSSHEQSKRQSALGENDLSPEQMENMGLLVAPVKFAESIALSKYFDMCARILILSNAAFIGFQVDRVATSPDGEMPLGYKIIDAIYASMFIIELFIRLCGSGCFNFFFGDDRSWNIFDLVVVTTGAFETIVSLIISEDSGIAGFSNLSAVRTIRIARVARIARVIRLMRFFRSLRILVTAIFGTVKNCLWTSLLLCLILYIFGVMFAQAASDHLHETDQLTLALSHETDVLREYFGTLPRSIYSCFKAILGGVDWEPVANALGDIGAFYLGLFLLMIIFVFLAVMNVISGLFLQSAIEHAQDDINEQIHHAVAEKNKYAALFEQMYEDMDTNEDGSLTYAEFERAVDIGSGKGSMDTILRALGIDAVDAWSLFKLLDEDNKGFVTRERFIDRCMDLKGTAKSMHMAQLRYELEWLMDAVMDLANFIEVSFKDVSHAVLHASQAQSLRRRSTAKSFMEAETMRSQVTSVVPRASISEDSPPAVRFETSSENESTSHRAQAQSSQAARPQWTEQECFGGQAPSIPSGFSSAASSGSVEALPPRRHEGAVPLPQEELPQLLLPCELVDQDF